VLRPADPGSIDDRPIRHHPPSVVASLPPAEGALGAPDVALQVAALRAGTAVRILHPQRRPWKELARARFARAFPGIALHLLQRATCHKRKRAQGRCSCYVSRAPRGLVTSIARWNGCDV
jgi:hypothetical protein